VDISAVSSVNGDRVPLKNFLESSSGQGLGDIRVIRVLFDTECDVSQTVAGTTLICADGWLGSSLDQVGSSLSVSVFFPVLLGLLPGVELGSEGTLKV